VLASRAQEQIDELRALAEPDRHGDDELEPCEAWSKLIWRESQSILQPAIPPLPSRRAWSRLSPSAIARRGREATRQGGLYAGTAERRSPAATAN
jgi:hypothetical protein